MTPAQEKKIDSLVSEVGDVKTEVAEIKTALIGSESNGNKGLVHEFYQEKLRLQALYDLKNQGKGAFWIIAILWAIGSFLIPLFSIWLFK